MWSNKSLATLASTRSGVCRGKWEGGRASVSRPRLPPRLLYPLAAHAAAPPSPPLPTVPPPSPFLFHTHHYRPRYAKVAPLIIFTMLANMGAPHGPVLMRYYLYM